MKKNKILYGLLLSSLFSACMVDNGKEVIDELNTGTDNLTFTLTRAGEEVNNSQVYLFDGDGSHQGQFKMKVPRINYGTNQLSMTVDAGRWDIALVTAATSLEGKLISPVRGSARSALKMWETKPENGVLPSMPELRTVLIKNQQVLANTSNTAATGSIYRNVAKIRVSIVDASGLNPAGTSTVELSNVPTTLNWDGGLYPNKNVPDVSSSPMRGTFTITNKPSKPGSQQSNVLEFIVPAHKGTDFLSTSPVDTTTSKLKLSINLATIGGTPYQRRDVEITRVPRLNGILDVKLTIASNLDVSADVVPWLDEFINADISATQLQLDKASVGLSNRDTLFVNTNAPGFTVEKASDATWLTVNKLNSNAVELIADLNTYPDNPRTSYITVKANNVSKKVQVTQRPDVGTITVSQNRLVFCPNHPTQSTIITTKVGNWKILAPSPKATASVMTGNKGATTVTFTRASTNDQSQFDNLYGDGQVVVQNTATLEKVTVDLINCFMFAFDNTINAVAPTGTAQSAVTNSTDILVFGGNRNLTNFQPTEDWIHTISWGNASQTLTMTTNRAPDDEPRDGHLTFAHAECPDYKLTVKVHQDIIVTIPPFDYFVVKFTWEQADVDIAVEFAGNSKTGDGTNNGTYDKKPMGYGLGNSVTYKNRTFLQWGGDATQGQGETTFFNAPVIEGDTESPRRVKLDIYATWWNYTGGSKDMTFTMNAYRGGVMRQVGTNFVNDGGESLYTDSKRITVTSSVRNPTAYATQFTKVATLTYDRIKHSATIHMYVPIVTGRNNNMAPPTLQETRSAHDIEVPFKPQHKPKTYHTFPGGVGNYVTYDKE